MVDLSTPTARGGYAKGDARREHILEVATEIFGTQGFRAATMLQIAAACDISRTGLLHHFPTKESLLEAVLAHRDATSGEQPEPNDSDPRARLRRILAVVEHNATQPRIVNLFSVLSAEAGERSHPAHDYFVQRYDHLRAELQEACRTLAATDQLAPGVDPHALAVEIIALMDGLQVQWVLAPEDIDMVAILRHRLNDALAIPLDA
ncbi:putative TetR family transcriptional regulator [Microlunatus phosphovorus NM-1]|uniref:Putative TetR family transcriptional regulator n=1 Tax=Microlunatus phosphovorus (strain ATCC 700054 / DSM 10555 / JCM 9379 / NBRC 101784 / NCIMB 13414 / VKM Ac-1990 / NM-1) TaxID=1032480 RepID=F5XIA5_MICPN|nr:TetR/AcrR family transcriptional regulator [Microlunatus phosphovorus]BAK35774.1 putative TetR family transcriptional regulator [Microlunatus phosphovorus NM-1]